MKYDVFISHASEDKESVARPLALALGNLGLRVWLDEFELTLGDSLRRTIDKGLASSAFGVVVLSPAFFEKEWPNKELDGLVAREDGKNKVILPIWHNLTHADVLRFSPPLADKLAASTSSGVDVVAKKVLAAVKRGTVLNTTPIVLPGESDSDALAAIRLQVIKAESEADLRGALYEVDEFLHTHPFHAQARALREQILQALAAEQRRRPPHPSTLPRPQPSQQAPRSRFLIAAAFAGFLVAGVVAWYQIRPKAPAMPSLPEELRVTSGPRLSGAGKQFSDWYELCSPELAPGLVIQSAQFTLQGDRQCNSWAECKESSRTPTRVCWQFRLQGHDELPPPGVKSSEGELRVKVVPR